MTRPSTRWSRRRDPPARKRRLLSGRKTIDMLARWRRRLAAVASMPPPREVARDIGDALSRGEWDAALGMVRTIGRPPDLAVGKFVSRKYRCLWLSNSKAASRTIKHMMRQADPCAEFFDETIHDTYARRPEARCYCSFAFVRHPFTRALSFHSEIHFAHERSSDAPFVRMKEAKRRRLFGRYPGLARTTDFEQYCRWLNTRYGSDAGGNRNFLSQHLLIRLDDGRLPDFIGRFEHLDADVHRLAARLGMPPTALPRLNTVIGHRPTPEALAAARSERAGLLTERSKALLRARYADDFRLLGFPPT